VPGQHKETTGAQRSTAAQEDCHVAARRRGHVGAAAGVRRGVGERHVGARGARHGVHRRYVRVRRGRDRRGAEQARRANAGRGPRAARGAGAEARDYRLLQALVGPGMHSRVTLPHPLGAWHASTVPALVLAALRLDVSDANARVLEFGSGRGFCSLYMAAWVSSAWTLRRCTSPRPSARGGAVGT